MLENLGTIFVGVSLLLAFFAASQVVRTLPARLGSGDLEPLTTTAHRRSWVARVNKWLAEAELEWDVRDIVIWLVAAITVLALLAITLKIPPVGMLFAAIVGLIVFFISLAARRSIRLGQFRGQFPEVVTIMARAVRAGLSIEESFQLGEQAARGRLRRELGKCAAQLGMGRSLPSALEAFSVRSGLREVGLLATILSVHQGTGGPLAEALERLSLLLRDQLMFRQQVLAATSGGRFSAYVIAPAAPVLFCVLLVAAPEHVSVFFEKPLGRTFLVFGAALNIIGIFWIYSLVKPKN